MLEFRNSVANRRTKETGIDAKPRYTNRLQSEPRGYNTYVYMRVSSCNLARVLGAVRVQKGLGTVDNIHIKVINIMHSLGHPEKL